MYRDAAAPPESERDTPAELVCTPLDRDRRSQPALAVFQLFAAPLVVGAATSLVATPTVAFAAMLVSAGILWWWWRRTARGKSVVFRVERGSLCLFLPRSIGASIPLADVVDVALDTKTIRPIQEGSSAIPAIRFIDSRVAPEVDTARIVLCTRDGRSVPLSEAYVAHMEATEWMGRIRVFLRKHGWVPEDERPSNDG